MASRLLSRSVVAFVAVLTCTATFATFAASADGAAPPFASALTRAPYLTDLVNTHVAVNFNTDKSGSAASVKWGPVVNGSCSLTSTVVATRVSVTVGPVAQYQWYAPIDLPGPDSYCYRPFLGSVDLLATSPSPVFTTQVPKGSSSSFTFDGLAAQTTTVRTGQYAALAASGGVANYAKRTLAASYADGYARTTFDVRSQSGQINLLRLRTADGTSIGYAYVTASGFLAFHDDATGTNTVSTTVIGSGWHVVEVHVKSSSSAGTADGTVQVWLDGTLLGALSTQAVDIGAAPIAALQIGDVQAGKASGVAFDDAPFGTARLGLG